MKHLNKTGFSYVVIMANNDHIKTLSTFLPSKITKQKYAMLFYTVHRDNSETLTHIKCSNNLEQLQLQANQFKSWYNYPIKLYKELQGNIYPIS